ncbi:MAG: hypothetical protein WDO24_13475 [Pseudomonadota bacterium]
MPEDQDKKLPLIQDAAMLLGPTLAPPRIAPPPSAAENIKAVGDFAAQLEPLIAKTPTDSPARQLARALAAFLPKCDETSIKTLSDMLDRRTRPPARRAAPVARGRARHPGEPAADLVHAWVSADGQARIEVFPKGDTRRNDVIERFVAAVRAVAPNATGAPVSIQESARTIVNAFAVAGATAVVVIAALLLRHPAAAARHRAGAGAAAARRADELTTCVALGLALNFANIIALPLLLGIGVAFDIYFVMNWRAG